MDTKNISLDVIKKLRELSGAGIMHCKKALVEAQGDIEKAHEILQQQSALIIEKKANRAVTQGLIETYIHTGGRIGAMLEVNCETDFVARTDEFKTLAHELAMQIAALAPKFISQDDIKPENSSEDQSCLLLQPYIRDPNKTVQDIINETIAKVGENIKIRRFVRFELGE